MMGTHREGVQPKSGVRPQAHGVELNEPNYPLMAQAFVDLCMKDRHRTLEADGHPLDPDPPQQT
ncbi:hypothetical protein OIN60_21965 [Paenibacillus sp. P96]|uniref:Uncharacterized protein n=1 Tax=Paenibacillus zeirhizosphaerae TaxID=2987519 RepID=A0ABT9FY48_9BACL|nr:hypothetical protein [Paenibacillus sp. P96]MDP4099387.1 hypothetical protein [Paenibacillus sp. P96]